MKTLQIWDLGVFAMYHGCIMDFWVFAGLYKKCWMYHDVSETWTNMSNMVHVSREVKKGSQLGNLGITPETWTLLGYT